MHAHTQALTLLLVRIVVNHSVLTPVVEYYIKEIHDSNYTLMVMGYALNYCSIMQLLCNDCVLYQTTWVNMDSYHCCT